MRTPLLGGIAAGAVGTIALDVVTDLDMVVRARPASSTSAEVAGALAERAGVELAAGLGLVAMAASDLPATALGVTDPHTSGAAGWATDLLPHLAYELATATVYEALAGRAG